MATTPPEWEVTEVLGRLPGASNATLLGRLGDDSLVVYKPVRGEAPLWDFEPESLAIREVLVFEVSEAAGWGVVPETRWSDGPYGPGSAQRFLHEDPEADHRTFVHPEPDDRLWPIAVLDLLTNNADRKLGHLLPTTDGAIWAIDNALTFHPDEKLRTVLWGFAGRRLPDDLVSALDRLVDVPELVGSAVGPDAAAGFRRRLAALRDDPVHPHPPTDRHPLPWPVW
jgi:uncharacterized repeat protein (TIGR03843 family)